MANAVNYSSRCDFGDCLHHSSYFRGGGDLFYGGWFDDAAVRGESRVEVLRAVHCFEVGEAMSCGNDVLDFVNAILGGGEEWTFAVCSE